MLLFAAPLCLWVEKTVIWEHAEGEKTVIWEHAEGEKTVIWEHAEGEKTNITRKKTISMASNLWVSYRSKLQQNSTENVVNIQLDTCGIPILKPRLPFRILSRSFGEKWSPKLRDKIWNREPGFEAMDIPSLPQYQSSGLTGDCCTKKNKPKKYIFLHADVVMQGLPENGTEVTTS